MSNSMAPVDLPPIELRHLKVAKKCKVFRNGDQTFPGKTITIDGRRIRNFDALLNGLTNDMKLRTGAVRKLCTPNHGHEVSNLDDIEDGKMYVAVGVEKYKSLGYNSIQPPSPRRSKRRNNDALIQPVFHNNAYRNIQSKHRDVDIHGKKIEIKVKDHYVVVPLSPFDLRNMVSVHKVVAEKLADCEQIRYSNMLVDRMGKEYENVEQIKRQDDLKNFFLTETSIDGLENKPRFLVPVLSPRDYGKPKFLWKERSRMHVDEKRPRTLPPIQTNKHSPDNSVRSFPDSNRKRNQVNGVPIRAAKHTKKTTRQADYDKDDGGVFKAKGQNRDTKGAREVRDTNDTKVDLPIDQVPAQEVKEEETIYEETEAKVPSGIELSRQPSDWLDQQDEKIKKEKQGKDNYGRNPPKQADHSHSKTVQNGDRSQGAHNTQSKTGVQNGKNTTSKSNSKTAPDQSQAKPNAKNSNSKTEVKKENPPVKENKNYNNHDTVRSSTPKDNKNAPPPQSTPSPMKDNRAEENKAATKIQANYRGHQARKEVTDLKKKKETEEKKQKETALKAKQDKEENEAATKIQATFRGHQARKEVNNKKQVREVRNSKEDAAATKIQAGFRGHTARKEIDAKKNKRTEKNNEEEVAATKIQAGFRGHKARKEVSDKKQARQNLQKEEDKAATKIQAGFRGHQARKEVENKKKEKQHRDEEDWAATKIQAGFRGHQARKDVQKKKVFSHETLSNDFIQKSDLAVKTTDKSKCLKESMDKNDIENKNFGSNAFIQADELNSKENTQNIFLSDENDSKLKQKSKLSNLNRGGTRTEISFTDSVLEKKHSEIVLSKGDKSTSLLSSYETDICNESKEDPNETNVQSKHLNKQIEISEDITKIKPIELAIPTLTKRELSRNSEKSFHNDKLIENDNEDKQTNTDHPSIKLPQIHNGKSVTFIDCRKYHVRSSSLQSLHNKLDNNSELKLGLSRSQTMGRIPNHSSHKWSKIHENRESLKLPPIRVQKSKSFTKDSLYSNLIDLNRITDMDVDRCKSAESSPRRNENAFPGYLVKTKTYPDLLNADLEKMFPILVAKSKRHKSYPYFEVRRSDSLGRGESGLRSATDSQASDLMDLGYFDTRLDNRSPGDGQSMTLNLEQDSIKIDSRLGHMGSFGETDSVKSESVLKTSRTGTFDESVEIEWKKKDTSLLNEIEDEEIELEMIKMKHLAATYIQAGIKGYLSRSTIAHKINIMSRPEDVTTLQASVRAMIFRKHLDIQAHEEDREVQNICENDAAIKIQSMYRGYRVRNLNTIKTSDKRLSVKKQVTFGEVSRIEIIDGKFTKHVRALGNEIEDEDPNPVGGTLIEKDQNESNQSKIKGQLESDQHNITEQMEFHISNENDQGKLDNKNVSVQFESNKPIEHEQIEPEKQKSNVQIQQDKPSKNDQTESNKPEVNIKSESNLSNVNIQPESNKPEVNIQSESNKLNINIQPESNKPEVNIQSESNKQNVNIQPESNKPEVNIQSESNKSNVNIQPESNKPEVNIQSESDKPNVNDQCESESTVDQNKAAKIIQSSYRNYKLSQVDRKSQALTLIQASFHSFISRKNCIEWLRQNHNNDDVLAIIWAKFKDQGKLVTTADKQVLDKDSNDQMQSSKAEAAKVIQTCFRGYVVRQSLKNQKERATVAAIVIQTFYKSYLVKRDFKKQKEIKCRAIVMIQANVRIFLARKEFIRHRERFCLAASKIQSNFKTYLIRKEFKMQKERQINAVKLLQTNVRAYIARNGYKRQRLTISRAVTLIQTNFRAYIARKEFKRQKEAKYNAAKVVQTNVRTYIARKEYKKHRARVLWAVTLIQTNFRAYLGKKEHEKQKETKYNAIKVIQTNVKAYLARKEYKKQRARVLWAVNLIQTNFRVYLAKKEHEKQIERKLSAIILIQSNVRTFLVRKNFQKEQKRRVLAANLIKANIKCFCERKTIRRNKKRLSDAVVVIQAFVRGFLVRKKHNENKHIIDKASKIIQKAVKTWLDKKHIYVYELKRQNSALIIQHAYQRYKTKSKQKFKTEAAVMVDNFLISAYTNYTEQIDSERKQAAAITIQTKYRGYRSKLKCTKHIKPESQQNDIQTTNDTVTHLQASFKAKHARMQYQKRFRELNSDNVSNMVSALNNIQTCQSLEEINIQSKDQNVTDLPQGKTKPVPQTKNCNVESSKASKKSNGPPFNMSRSFSRSSDKLTSIKEEKDLESIYEKENKVTYNSKVSLSECDQFGQLETTKKGYDLNQCMPKTKDTKPGNGIESTNNNPNKTADILQAAYKSDNVQLSTTDKCVRLIKYEAQTTNDSLTVIKHFLCSCLQASVRGYISREGLFCYFTPGKNFVSNENVKQKEIGWYVSKLNSFQNGGGVARKWDVGYNNKYFTKFQSERLDEKVDAVTYIQAAARGYLVRRRIEKRENTKMLLRLRSAAQEEVMDILGLIHERDKAATTIQSNYRGYRDRKDYKRVKVKNRKEESATFLQANIRAFLARKDINKRLLVEIRKIDTPANRQNYNESIDKVQASFHGYLFRKVINVKRHQLLVRKDCITVLQASIRGHLERWHIRRKQLAELARYHNTASEIQLTFKSFLARRNIEIETERRNRSASKIQAGVRGYLTRKGYLHSKLAATRIQSGYRGYRARQQYDHIARERRNSAATVIQSRYRGFRVRNDIHIQTRQHALAQLHASFRGFIFRKDISLSLRNEKKIEMQRAAIKIQSKFRGYAARHQYELRKRNHTNDIQQRKAITEIQAHFHGYLARKNIDIPKNSHLNRLKSKDSNSPMFLEGSLRFDLQTTGSITPGRPRTGRLRASLSKVSREQTYVIGGTFKDTNDNNLKHMARSTTAHVDSFSHLQDSFRSLLSSRRKSSKTPQQVFHENTRLKAVSQIQACFKGLLTRRLISQKYQYDENLSKRSVIPSPAPQVFENPNEIHLNGSFENPSSHISFYDHNGESTALDSIPPEVSYHRQYSDVELRGSNGGDLSNDNAKTPTRYILRNNSQVDISQVRHSTPVDNLIPVQYLYRSRESTRHQYSSQTFRKKTDDHRYEEPSPIQAHETEIQNPILTDRSRFEEPSPLVPNREEHMVTNHDEVSMSTDRDRFEEPSPIPNSHDQSNANDTTNFNRNERRYEEPSPPISHSGSPLLGDTDQKVYDEISVDIYSKETNFGRYEESKQPSNDDMKSFDRSDDTSHRFEEPSPQVQNSADYVHSMRNETPREENDLENHEDRYEEPSPIENKQTITDIQNRNYSNYNNRRFEEPSPLPDDMDEPRTENPASPRDTVCELPNHGRFMQNTSRTPISTDSEVSVDTYSRKLINEVQSSSLLKDEALLILQAAFKGFLIRNRSHSHRLKRISKLDLNDKTIFEETAVPFLQAGFKGYLEQKRDVPSPPEM